MVRRHPPVDAPAPVVVDSPHSGRVYPSDFRPAVSRALLEGGEDRFVDALFAEAPLYGAEMVAARFARTYIDPNRGLGEIDPGLLDDTWPWPVSETERVRLGVGLVFRKVGPGIDIYDRKLSVAELRRRVETCWQPYHDALREALDAAHGRAGVVFHLNCHSMEPFGNELSPDPGAKRPHFVLGDLDGRSCAPDFTAFVVEALRGLGYTVAVNDPYKGAELVERYSDPKSDRHSLQIEVNRGLYMDGKTREKHDGFAPLKRDLGRMLARLCDYARAHVRSAAPGSGSEAPRFEGHRHADLRHRPGRAGQ